ncbi:hypothetical protein [Dermatobacter hominis]|uniref:hypothetical protein n=1 Tax=Dermatobacter hominis TaxID=2884263 RepID=UPI001D107BF5|nr:hypothetical protein [Dermatobacter hominis]UDY33957.1 hypothetical protein LH044_11425 [Dermatobacter hominis]
MSDRLDLPWQSGDRPLNLTLEPYDAPAGPVEGALRSASVLRRSTEWTAKPARAEAAFAVLQDRLGPDRLVWAVGLRDDRPAWELYVYNGAAASPISPSELRRAWGGAVTWTPGLVQTVESLGGVDPWSVDLDPATLEGSSSVVAFNGYVNAGAEAALSYRITTDGPRLTNLYRRFPSSERKAIVRAASRTLHLAGIDRVAHLEPADHLEVHLAQKPDCDGVYWVGVPTVQAVEVCLAADPSGRVADLLGPDLDRLGHLRFDVGIDVERNGSELRIRKVAIYGVL